MFKTSIIFVYFWCFMSGTLLWFVPWFFLLVTGRKELLRRYLRLIGRYWSRHFLRLVGARVTVRGVENVPPGDRICFIANHQSIFDILLILGYSGRAPGFIAKKELAVAPVLNLWMLALHCVFIERKNAKKALRAIDRGVRSLRKGYPMAVFPEGTRSRDGIMRRLKPGSLKLATRSDAVIVPVTLDGSFRLFEEKGRFTPADVTMTIHPPVPTEGLSVEERKSLAEKLEGIIQSALPPESRIDSGKAPA